MGVKVDVVKGVRDYKWFFRHTIKSGVNKGKISGFPLAGMCCIQRDCKITPIRKYLRQFDNVVQYIGIAKDEPNRLERLDGKKKISLLDKYGYSEAMARQKAEEYD